MNFPGGHTCECNDGYHGNGVYCTGKDWVRLRFSIKNNVSYLG